MKRFRRATLTVLPLAIGCLLGACAEDAAHGKADASTDAEPSADALADANIIPDPGEDAATVADESPTPDLTQPSELPTDPGPPDVPVADSGAGDDLPVPPDAPDVPSPPDVPPDVTAASEVDAGAPTLLGELCFSEIYEPGIPGPDYDQFAPTAGSHCYGTNHQAIADVEQLVILGDSVAQGTPNDVHPLSVDNEHFWRNRLATWAADHFGLDTGDFLGWGSWKTYDYVTGMGGAIESGDLKNCAKWGARTDDLLAGGGQIPQCFPDGGSDKKTLVVFTMGGNDISAISQLGAEASPDEVAAGYPSAWALAESTVNYLAEALQWLKDPEHFPNGSWVVFANPFEFTDSTGDVDSCQPGVVNVPFVGEFDLSDFGIPLAGLAGYGAWEEPAVQEAIVIWMLESFMQLAVETQTDMIWMLEHFCGHGFVATGPDADVNNRCYRGPDAELYFDITCIHPSDAGHEAIYEMFKATILE